MRIILFLGQNLANPTQPNPTQPQPNPTQPQPQPQPNPNPTQPNPTQPNPNPTQPNPNPNPNPTPTQPNPTQPNPTPPPSPCHPGRPGCLLLAVCRLRLYPTGLKNSKMKTVTATTDRHMTNIITHTAGLYGSETQQHTGVRPRAPSPRQQERSKTRRQRQFSEEEEVRSEQSGTSAPPLAPGGDA